MAYILVFLEGVITFISPCILPMIPIYLSYMADLGQCLGLRSGFQPDLHRHGRHPDPFPECQQADQPSGRTR